MEHFCLLDQLPVELLHNLFDYFVIHEILFSFSNISEYINSIIQSYSNHRFHCISIRKSHFNFICRHIRPEQVISLVLSDANDAPGLTRLFFSHFRLEQFIRLRSLTLIDVDFDSLEAIFAHLDNLKQLRALSFNEQSIRYPYSCRVQPTTFHFTDIHMRILSRLNRLHLSNDTTFTSISLRQLRHLELDKCVNSEFERIFQLLPQLRSLSGCLNLREANFDLTIHPNKLSDLRLEIQGKYIRLQ